MKVTLSKALSIALTAFVIFPALPVQAAENKAAGKENEAQKQVPDNKESKPFAEIDARIKQFDQRLLEDLSTGRLNPKQSETLRGSLEQIAELEAEFRHRPAKFRHWQLLRLQVLLDKLQERVTKSEGDRDLASVDLQFTKQDISRRIELAEKQSKLTPQEVADLKGRFKNIVDRENKILASRGRLAYHDKLSLCIDYDHLGTDLQRFISQPALAEPDLNEKTAEIHKRIADAVKAGKLGEAKGDEIKKKLSDLKGKSEASRQASGKLSDEQILALGLALEDLANTVELAFDEAMLDLAIDLKLSNLDRRLALAIVDGELRPLEMLDFKDELEELKATREKLKAESTPAQNEEMSLALDLSRYEGRLDRQIHGPSLIYPGITVSLAHVSHRISESLKAKRLSEEDAKSLRLDLGALNKRLLAEVKSLRETQNADKPVATSESLSAKAFSLSQDLHHIAARLEKSLKDRELEAPSTESLKTAIDSRIGDYVLSGELSAGDAQNATAQLRDLDKIKDKYASSDSSLSTAEKLALAFEMERLACGLEEQIRGHEALFPGIYTRRKQIEALVKEGISSGRLEQSGAAFYKDKLSENEKLEKQYRNAGMTGEKSLELLASLEQIWSQLDRELREKQVTLSDIVSLEGNAEKKIRQGFSSGQLSVAESESLRGAYNRLVQSFQKLRADDGGMSWGESLALAYGFERLMAQVERSLRQSPLQIPDIEEERENIEKKLAALLASGKLPMSEARELKAKLDGLAKTSSARRASGGGISYQEFLIIAVDLRRLSKSIDQRLSMQTKASPDIDSLQAELSKKIEEAKASKTLNQKDYQELKQRMDQIAASEAEFRISEEALNFAEVMDLFAALEEVKNKLSGKKDDKSKDSKPAPKAETKPAAKAENKKAAAKAEDKKTAAKAEDKKTAAKAEDKKTAAKAGSKPASKPESGSTTKTDGKPALKTESKPESANPKNKDAK